MAMCAMLRRSTIASTLFPTSLTAQPDSQSIQHS
jgi:hypothetical protein